MSPQMMNTKKGHRFPFTSVDDLQRQLQSCVDHYRLKAVHVVGTTDEPICVAITDSRLPNKSKMVKVRLRPFPPGDVVNLTRLLNEAKCAFMPCGQQVLQVFVSTLHNISPREDSDLL